MSPWIATLRRGALACLLVGLFMTMGSTVPQARADNGRYVSAVAERIGRLIDEAERNGYRLQDDSPSVGGAWLRQSATNWVEVSVVQLERGRQYLFLASGDQDSRDVDLRVVGSDGAIVAKDDSTAREAAVQLTPQVGGRYTVQLRLYASDNRVPCMCMTAVMVRK